MFIFEGFLIGLFGSLHCIGMCGPLVLALPLSHAGNTQRLFGGILYNLGRSVTYAVLGIVFGLLGKTLQIFGLLSWVSIIFGIILILAVILPGIINVTHLISRLSKGINNLLINGMGKLMQQEKVYPLFIFGLLNGLLPCGLVYGAIMGAIVTGSLVDSSIYMFLFGLGTLPIMFLLIYFSDLIKSKFLRKVRGLIPVFVVILGILFILRGLNLGIKYISPDFSKAGKMMHMDKTEETAPMHKSH